ncbi:FAD-binding protein [Gordonibacter sp.]|uniref:FAD-binding protein n=1 Tax=Gordonibacter sp. TaxID=1968902 RepID=UPI002FC82055
MSVNKAKMLLHSLRWYHLGFAFVWAIAFASLPFGDSSSAGLLAVVGDIHVSDHFEVIDAEDRPVEGLYAIGNCSGDLYAYDYPINVQGNSHGRCLVGGKCLGEQLAGVYQEI